MKKILFILFVLSAFSVSALADVNLGGRLPSVLTYAPNLNYPPEGIRKVITGGGVYRMKVNPDGVVTATEVVQTTGSQVLDRAALAGLKRWRFKRGSIVGWAKTPCLWTKRGYYFGPPLRNSPIIAIAP